MPRELVVLPDLFVDGWSGTDTPKVFPRTTWEAACEPQATDAMVAPYLVPGDAHQPRLNKAALSKLRDLGQEPELHWVFLDFDRPGHTPWPSLGEASLALALALAAVHPTLPGAGGYTSRAGLRLVWHLDPPLPCSLAQSFLAPLLAEVADLLPDLEADEVSTRWTTLYRTPRARRDGEVLEAYIHQPGDSLDPYTLAEGRGWKLASEADADEADYGDAPAGPLDLTFDQWKAAWAHPYLKSAGPIPEEAGHRYPKLRSILADVARAGEVTDAHQLVSYVWDSVENTPGLTIAQAWKLACWVAHQEAKAALERAKEEEGGPPEDIPEPSLAAWAEVRRHFRGRDRRLFERLSDGVALHPQPTRLEEATLHALRVLAEKARVPTATELYAFVRRSNAAGAPNSPTEPELWERCLRAVEAASIGDDNEAARVIFCEDTPLTIKQVGKGGALFQLDTTSVPPRYVRSDATALYLHFDRYTRPNLPFEAEYPTNMPLPQLLRLYGRTVEKVVYTSGQEGTVYDRAANYISQGVHRLASARAQYHSDIDTYLRLLGASDWDGFSKWLAGVTYSSQWCLPALYLVGPPSAGKSLLAAGIASLWASSPVDYDRLGDFNGSLLQSPLLHADEGITGNSRDEGADANRFRNYVANTQHELNAKHQQPAYLHAALRVLVTANDGHGIPFKKALGQDGINAITQRILYVEADPAVVQYLEGLGGRAGITHWIGSNAQPGAFAEHLLWMRDHVNLERRGRFLVEGKPTAWHRTFVADQGYKPAVLSVIASLLKHQQGNRGMDLAVRADPEGRVVWVHHSAVFEHWDGKADTRRPKASLVKETVEMLATGEAKQIRVGTRRPRCYPIPFTAFVDAAILEWGDFGFVEGEE